MTIELIEIIGRSEQGITRPFICRGDDNHVYFVKGRNAGRRSLICEWVAGQLALRLGLPIAPFEIVYIPPELVSIAMREDLRDLGVGNAFASRKLPAVELSASQIAQVPVDQQCDVLAFDWWVCNSDRTLGERGGNPNLLWDIAHDQLVVIDHNQAFDPCCSAQEFLGKHAFWGQAPMLFHDWVVEQGYAERFQQAMLDWEAICASVPSEWRFLDDEQTLPTDFDFHAIGQWLMRYRTDNFWTLT
ncbi:HipA family kinase [Acidithiobacillus sp. AMEEHan]|uniref:HipA family kinase n=1 Tax=Acidithiobacillus sp. AMEEHan TaxID=2994951 RepID=UPI0027E55D66|nr:HipA family kinase [Acidithiobacillus sp. AMEEHan]